MACLCSLVRNIVAQRARLAARPKDAPLELKATGT
jgi:hypothetical protein